MPWAGADRSELALTLREGRFEAMKRGAATPRAELLLLILSTPRPNSSRPTGHCADEATGGTAVKREPSRCLQAAKTTLVVW